MRKAISVCVPSLHTRPFLPARFESIFSQSFQGFELLVYDSYSEDGSWEFIQEATKEREATRIWQGPREGIYAAWNTCIEAAQGEYIYIATSDDTMAPDCLELLLRALQAHPECDLAHCPLRVVDQDGNDMPDWWSRSSLFALSSPGLLSRPHVRLAPFDGLLHLGGESVYISATQLLIRRSLFDRIGLYERRWGSVSDFNWCMRAGLVANTVHVPQTWAGWRVYHGQATSAAGVGSANHSQLIDDMIRDAISRSYASLDSRVGGRRVRKWARYAGELRRICLSSRTGETSLKRRLFLLRCLLTGSRAAQHHMMARLRGKGLKWPGLVPDLVRGWLAESGIPCVTAACEEVRTSAA